MNNEALQATQELLNYCLIGIAVIVVISIAVVIYKEVKNNKKHH